MSMTQILEANRKGTYNPLITQALKTRQKVKFSLYDLFEDIYVIRIERLVNLAARIRVDGDRFTGGNSGARME